MYDVLEMSEFSLEIFLHVVYFLLFCLLYLVCAAVGIFIIITIWILSALAAWTYLCA